MSRSGGRKKPLPKRIAGGLLRLIAARPQGMPKLKPSELRRVLIMRYDKIGDMVITTPLIEALHRVAPQARIDVLAGRANAGLIKDDPRIHRIHLWERSLLKRFRTILACRREGYDLTLQLVFWRTTLPGLLAGLLTPKGRIVSRDNAGNRELFEHTVVVDASRHYSTQVFRFLAGSLDLGDSSPEMPPYSIHIPPRVEEEVQARLHAEGVNEGGHILLNISAGERARELSDERNIELIERLTEIGKKRGLRVGVTGAPEDAGRVEKIVERANEKQWNSPEEKVVPLLFSSLTAAAACIKRARLIVTPDTGTNHIASGVGTPTVAFYTKNGRPAGWGPFGVPHRIIQATEGGDTSTVKIEEIVRGVEELIESI